MRTWFVNARLVTPFELTAGVLAVEEGEIVAIAPRAEIPAGDRIIDARGLYLAPGFIDLHVHGGGGFSAMSDLPADIAAMARAHAAHGTTSILPTTLSAPPEAIRRAIRAIRAASELPTDAQILGAHLEGPCLNPLQCGAQPPDDLRAPDQFDMEELLDAWPGGVRMVGAAPELPGGLSLGDLLARRGIVASIAHSNATYEQVQEAVLHGYRDVTHLYSGCSGLIRVNGYRVPGLIEAGLNLDALTAQVIADGKHLPLSLLSLIYRCKGADGIVLITDGLDYAAGELEEGTTYRQKNGVETVFEDGVMKLPDRQAFAGSVATMNRLVRNMVLAGVPLAHAVRMATDNPARRISAARKGRLATCMDADLVLFDDEIAVKFVMRGGRVVTSAL